MKKINLVSMAAALVLASAILSAQPQRAGQAPVNPNGPFKVSVANIVNGSLQTTPAIPAEGATFQKGQVIKVKAVPAQGYSFDAVVVSKGSGFRAVSDELMTQEIELTVGSDMTLGASFVESSRLEGFKVIQDIVYAKPGVKTLKYDAFIPDGAKNLPAIVIIHGGGWQANNENVMRGMAREMVKDGRYAVFCIDYRWQNLLDGDKTPNGMHCLIEDCYGAILHIQERAAEYGIDPNNIGITGDSAGGHLAACVATMVERVGDGGFGTKPGVYEYLPTYLPKGMNGAAAQKSLLAIKAVAPNYGIFSVEGIRRFFTDLGTDEQAVPTAPLNNIPDVKTRAIPHWINRGSVDSLISDESTQEYFDALQAAGQEVYYIKVAGANHAFYDWKSDARTQATFDRFGVPYTAAMKSFFDTIFYK